MHMHSEVSETQVQGSIFYTEASEHSKQLRPPPREEVLGNRSRVLRVNRTDGAWEISS